MILFFCLLAITVLLLLVYVVVCSISAARDEARAAKWSAKDEELDQWEE